MTGSEAVKPSPARDRIAELTAIVTAARNIVAHGDQVNLAGFESRAEEVCRVIATTSVEEAATLVPALTLLLDNLDQLKRDLMDQHTRLARQLGDVNARTRAVRAYNRPPHPR
jgi:hypothetical protein